MKKNLLLVLIAELVFCNIALSQTPSRTFRQAIPPKDGNTPALFQINRDVLQDTVTQRYYIQREAGMWSETKSLNIGAQGIQGIQGVKGDKGDAGGGSGNSVTPEQFGACGCYTTPDADANGLQAAINSGKKIEMDGTKIYYINKLLKRQKYQSLNIEGHFSKIEVTISTAGDVLGCDQPTSANDGVIMVNYTVSIRNLSVICKTNQQNGFNVKASSNDRFENVTVTGANWAFRSEFMLQSRYTECTVLSCANGWYIGTGTFTGADLNNSQSNYSWLIQPHTHTVSNIGIFVQNCYGVRIDDAIIEGNNTIVNGILFDAVNSTTTKNLYINTVHFEQIGGCTDALIKLNSRDAIVEITDVIMHYKGLMIDASSSTGNGSVLVTKCSYAAGDSNGKLLKSGNVTWQFNYNNLFQCWSLPNMWAGTVPKKYTGSAGYNQYNCQDWAR